MSFTPSQPELALVAQIFAKADPQKIGILTGDGALKVFGGAKLPPTVLGEIWSIADEDNNGWLPRKGVAIAVRLMGWAQKGEKVTEALVNKRECKSKSCGWHLLMIRITSGSFAYN
jgi:epidermal growth factor receptor substrate 15